MADGSSPPGVPAVADGPAHRPPFPVGWFAVADAAAVPEGALVPLAAFGQDLAVGRTPSGGALVVHATCPHLGADLAAGGRIDDDRVVCPLHEWCFSHGGACTSAADGPVPDGVELRVWPTEVAGGAVWAFHGRSGEQPPGPPPAAPAGGSQVEVAGHPEDVLVGVLVGLGAGDAAGDGDAWSSRLADGDVVRVHGPGTVEAGGRRAFVTPVDGFTVAVRATSVADPEWRAEPDRSVLPGFRDWYRRFDRSSAPARRPARSGRRGRERNRG